MLRWPGVGGGGGGGGARAAEGVTWGASLLLRAGTLGFGVQQRIYTGLYVCTLQCVCACVCVCVEL